MFNSALISNFIITSNFSGFDSDIIAIKVMKYVMKYWICSLSIFISKSFKNVYVNKYEVIYVYLSMLDNII